MPEKKTLSERSEKVVSTLQSLLYDYSDELSQTKHLYESAICKANAVPLPVGVDATQITKETLAALGLAWNERWNGFVARIRRLSVCIREDGSWSTSFDATYGGSVSSYRDLQNIGEVEQLLHLFGWKQFGGEDT